MKYFLRNIGIINNSVKQHSGLRRYRFQLLFLLFPLLIGNSCAQQTHLSLATDSINKVIADSFIRLHPDTVAYRTEAKSYRWNYEQGLVLYSFYQMYKLTGDSKYYEYVKKNIDYYIKDDGTIKTYKLEQFNIDNIAPGRVLLALYKETGIEKYKKAADSLRKQLDLHPRTSEGGFWHKKVYPFQMWLDGLYMAEPFYSEYASLFNSPASYDDIANQFLLIEKHLKDEATGLYVHGWDESREQKWADSVTGKSPNFWGRSLGWFIMAMTDVLDTFPEKHKDRKALLKMYVSLSESIVRYRDEESKLWLQVVDKGQRQGNYIETSSSLMFIYALAKGYNKGYLNKDYLEIARESFNSLLKDFVLLDAKSDLYLNNICSVGGLGGKPFRDGSFEYYISEPIRVNDFKGYGPFILASIELAKAD